MLTTLAVHGYRSLRNVVLPLAPVTVVTGANGSGKSSLYRALRLLGATATTGVVGPLARDGGLDRVLWAGPEVITGSMRRGEVSIQGASKRSRPVSLMLGFVSDEFGYLADIGLPVPSSTMFGRDPIVKREEVFAPPILRPSAALVRRQGRAVRVTGEGTVSDDLGDRVSILGELHDPRHHPEVAALRKTVTSWRFYDGFRTDAQAPARQPCVGTWTPVLAEDGHDLAAAIQTILESAWADPFNEVVERAFAGTRVRVSDAAGRFEVLVNQPGMLRPLGADELSDGTLRFLLLATALLSPRPPSLLVLNEPETSLHPHVLPVVADLMRQVSQRTQVLVVSHADGLVRPLLGGADNDPSSTELSDEDPDRADQPGRCLDGSSGSVLHHHLVKCDGETMVEGQGLLTTPSWEWGRR